MSQTIIDHTFQQVVDFVSQTNHSVFLTGKAGTGKTTLLKYIKANCLKQMAVVAPTGVAAINAGGTTIHSLFQLPFQPFLPEHSKQLLQTLKLQRQRLNLLRQLELLIIDEVSMVRCDILDAIDAVLRSVRRQHHIPFGGVQLLLIGDMFQLPPVIKNEDWEILSSVYSSPFFFDCKVLQEQKPIYIELTKVYRQNDQTFIDLLNKVRNNKMDEAALKLLNSRYIANISDDKLKQTITLTTHNYKADSINQNALSSLKGKAYTYKATINGNFPDRNYPVDENLVLKQGAQVMFLKNDTEKRYFNGKIGTITEISADTIKVTCADDKTVIDVSKEVWENINYSVNKSTNKIEEDKQGDFLQYPLRLAWAITIHKSQGLTFDEVIIDAQEAFSAGQVYVALSRCRSLEGLILKTPLDNRSLNNDQNVLSFSETGVTQGDVSQTFQQAKKSYLTQLLFQLFLFTDAIQLKQELKGYIDLHKKHLTPAAVTWFQTLHSLLETLQGTAEKFNTQLQSLFAQAVNPEQDEQLQERISKASSYFDKELLGIIKHLKEHTLTTESKLAHQDITPLLNTLYDELFTKQFFIAACGKGFILQEFVKQKLKLQLPSVRLNAYATSKSQALNTAVSHPNLLRELMAVRDEIVDETGQPIYMIANKQTLEEMAEYLPQRSGDLLMIKGFGKAKTDAFGERFLEVIKNYCAEHQLESNMVAKNPQLKKKEKKSTSTKLSTGKKEVSIDITSETTVSDLSKIKLDTKQTSYLLYLQLKDLAAVAQERKLTVGTIEGHLAHFVKKGLLPINDFIPNAKQVIIETALAKTTKEEGLTGIMGILPTGYTYGEVRMVQAHLEWKAEMVNG